MGRGEEGRRQVDAAHIVGLKGRHAAPPLDEEDLVKSQMIKRCLVVERAEKMRVDPMGVWSKKDQLPVVFLCSKLGL